jgi:hypothetical protein
MTAQRDVPLGGLSEGEMAALISRIADELSTRGTREAFAELLHVMAYVGERVGDAARAGVVGFVEPGCPGVRDLEAGRVGTLADVIGRPTRTPLRLPAPRDGQQ